MNHSPYSKRPNRYRQATFLISASQLSQLPDDSGIEVAFAGRSNAGKSSALNTITDVRGLARTSKTPGRTQLINLFELDSERRLVDLPGYGYAKVPERIKIQWQQTLGNYLEKRKALRGIILVMDVRHPFKEFDRQMLDWCRNKGMPTHILMTKADKLKRGGAMNALQGARRTLKELHPEATIQLFSALKGTGLDETLGLLDEWYCFEDEGGTEITPS